VKRILASASVLTLALLAPLALPPAISGKTGMALAQSAVTLDNLSFKGDSGSVSIPRITVEGSTASKTELEVLFDARSFATLAQRLSQFSARSITIPMIEIIQALPDARSVTTYKDLVLRDVRNGLVAEATAPLTTASARPATASKGFPGFEMTMAGMTMKGVDLPLMLRFFFDKAQPGESLKVAMAEQTIGKTTYKVANTASFTFNEISARDFKLRPLKTPLNEIMAKAGELQKDKSKEGETFALSMMTDILGSMSFGNMEMKGMAGEAAQPGKPPVKFSLDRLGGAGGADLPGRFTLQGFKLLNGKDGVNIADITLEGISLSGMMAAFEKMAASGALDGKDVDPAAFIPKIDLIRMAGIDIDVPDTKDPKERIRAKLGLFETKLGNHVGAIPANIAIALERLQLDIPPNTKEKGLQDILAMGYKAIDLTARYTQTWDEASKVIKVNELSLGSAGMFAAKLTAELANVPKEIFTLDKAVAAVAALGVSAKAIDLNLTNDSLFEKLIAKQAKDTRRKPEDVRAEFAAGATLMVPMMLGDHPGAKALGAALGKFVAEPRNLKISLKAQGGGIGATDFLAVRNPMDILKKVDISAAANE
jgi:hypothetical protein